MTFFALAGPARADEPAATTVQPSAPAPAPPPPGLTLPAGAFSALVTTEVNLASDSAAEPWSIAPDLGYGVTEDLTLMIVHSTYATTGFRGSAGSGLCLAGDDSGCVKPYGNVGGEAHYGFLRGPFSLAAVGGVHAAFREDMAGDDMTLLSGKLGARTRWTAGQVVAMFTPSLFVGLDERDSNKESVWLPVAAGYKIVPQVTAGMGTGINGPIEDFDESFRIPIGVWASVAPRPNAIAGASFTFGRITGGSAMRDMDQTGTDFRALQVWLGYTL
jgi:hypothetical protein